MKKFILIFLVLGLFCTIFSSCTQNQSLHNEIEKMNIIKIKENEKIASSQISRSQMSEIWELCSEQFLSEAYTTCRIYNISNIAEIKHVKEFAVNNKKYYFNIFTYEDYKLILIYDCDNILYASLFYSKKIDYDELINCKNFDDVRKIDSTLKDDTIAFNSLSVEMLTRFTGYQYLADSDNKFIFDESSLHFTDKGLLFIGYSLCGTNKLVISVKELVDDPVYCKVYDLICEQYDL